jgi:ABC-type lipoprotein export system ATPase subunit
MIGLDQVSKTYVSGQENAVRAVREVSLKIERGEFVVITGRSGSGKTTLLNLIAGLTRPTSGTVRWDQVDLWTLPDHQQARLRGQKVGFVFQFPSLLPALNSLDNVVLPTLFSRNNEGEDRLERAAGLLELVGLKDKLNAYPRQLSAGQQQRVVIARALINLPQVLLADEPTSDLDEQTETEIMDLFKKVHGDTGITIVLVTHSSQLVQYGSRSIIMAGGGIAA